MSLISATIPNLVNGISQQPATSRLASQAEIQLNALSSVASGLSKRPPSTHLARLSAYPMEGAFVHTINRDRTEQYVVVISGGDLKVFDINTGTERAVAFPQGKGYLSAANPATDFRAVSVLDYTFIVNRRVRVAEDTPVITDGAPYSALVWVRQAAYATSYKVTLDGKTYAYQTRAATTPEVAVEVQTDSIAEQLRYKLATEGPADVFHFLLGSTLYMTSTRPFTVSVSDSIGDGALKLVKGTVQSFADLPAKAPPEFRVRVNGTSADAFDAYDVQYKATADNPQGGVWREAMKAGERYRIKSDTMPWTLRRLADGTFSFAPGTYKERTVGSLENAPFPSFVGQTINDVLFHRNRLGFLSGENVALSRAGDYFNFFRETALQVLDTDPIDVAVATGGGAAVLNHAVAFNEGLLLFSDQAQFQFGKTDLLTPRTASITLTTQFGCSADARPVGAGKNVFFTYARGSFAAIREYYLDGDTRTNDAADVTAHCPNYLPSGIRTMAVSTNESTLVCAGPAAPNSLWVYRYYWQGTTKLQSAWSQWSFDPGSRVVAFEFIRSALYVVVSRTSGLFLEVVNFDAGRRDTGVTFEWLLDRRVSLNAPVADQGTTAFALPYPIEAGGAFQLVCAQDGGGFRAGQIVPFEIVNPTKIRCVGTVPPCIFGVPYTMRYRFSTLLLREEAAGGGQQPVTQGRFQVRRMTVSYANTGYFRAEVTPTARDTYRYPFSGRVLGSQQSTLGAVATADGSFGYAVAAQNTEVAVDLVNDSPLPSTFLSASWEAFYASRSRRV